MSSRRKPPPPKRVWQPLERTVPTAQDFLTGAEIWANDRYTVVVRAHESDLGPMIHLSIKRNDRKAARDWRDFQRIKNEVVGAEAEAVELYPAMSRLVDQANQYHLWCLPPGKRFPFAWDEHILRGTAEAADYGAVQRELPEDWKDQ